MKFSIMVLSAALGILGSPAIAAQQTLNFDDISGTSTVTEYLNPNVAVYANYGGFNWGPRWAVVNGFGECGASPCGFKFAQTSGNFTATNVFNSGSGTISSATPFKLISIQLGSAWYDPLSIAFVGKLGGVNVWTQTFDVTPYGATLATFPSGLIDSLEVTPTIAGPHVYTLGSGPRMVWDDFTFELATVGGVPEPAAWSVLITGFGLVGVVARRRETVVTA